MFFIAILWFAGCQCPPQGPSPQRQLLESLASTNPANSRPVLAGSLGYAVKVIGPLGEPLGKVVLIEGWAITEREMNRNSKAPINENFAVDTIDGQKLESPAWIQLELPHNHPPLKEGKRERFTGFQTGGFINEPWEAYNFERVYLQTTGWYFLVYFVVLEPPKNSGS